MPTHGVVFSVCALAGSVCFLSRVFTQDDGDDNDDEDIDFAR